MFKYNDKVKVISGFYEGIEGFLTDYSGVDNRYYLQGTVFNFGLHTMVNVNIWVGFKEIEKIR